MSRQSSGPESSFLRSLLTRLWKRPELKAASRRTRRRMFMEPLEGRTVLASNLGVIEGLVFVDTTGDGLSIGEEVSGAIINLYSSDGDANFEPGAGDALITSRTTDGDGNYSFQDLPAGTYWVEQPAQTVGGKTLLADAVILTIDSTMAQGTPGSLIDSFATAGAPTVVANDPVGTTASGFADLPETETIGGQRDYKVQLTASTGGQSVTFTTANNKLELNPSSGAQGKYTAVWDGDADDDGNTIDFTGLGNRDLTDAGESAGILLEDFFVDQAGATATIRVYTDSGNFSTRVVNIPASATSDLFFKFSDFTTTAGTGADFTDVGAIELEINTTVNAMDGNIDFIQAMGYDGFKQNDFDNFVESDLELSMVVDDASPNVGDDVTYTITVVNGGPDTALNVAVKDQLPAGLTFVSSNPSQGTYNSTTGIWSVGTMTAGATVTLDLVATVSSLGAKTNTAEISASGSTDSDSTPNNGIATEDDIDTVVVTPEQIDLSVQKTVNNPNVTVGSQVTFTIIVANATGMSNATNVAVKDQLPSGFTFVSANPLQGTYDNTTGIWTVGTVNSGSNATLSIVATKNAGGAVTNAAEVSAADQADIDSTPDNRATIPGEDDTATAVVNDPSIDLVLTQTVNNNKQVVGQQVTFTLTLGNTGSVNATGVAVTDQLPAGLTFVSSNPSQGTYDSGTGIWTVGTVNAAGTATLSIVATVASTGAKTNVAEVTAAAQPDVDSTPNNKATAPNEDDTASVVVTPATIDLALTQAINNPTQVVGQNVTITLTLANSGSGNATGVAVTDLLPAGLTFVSSNPSQGTYDSGTGIWTVGTVNAAANATLSIVASVAATGSKTNIAEVTAVNETDVDSTPNNRGTVATEDDTTSAVINPGAIDLALTKTVNNNKQVVGQPVTFTIIVSNTSSTNATGVAVTDQLPAGLTFVSSNPAQGTYDSGTGVWTVGTVNAGATATLTVTATVATAGAKTNTAEVTAAGQTDIDSTPNNKATAPTEDDTASVIVTPASIDLNLTQTVNNPTQVVGQPVTFTLTLGNTGSGSATGVAVTDQLPAGLTFVSSNPSQGTYDNTTGIWTVGTINAAANATLTITATVATTGVKTNVAEVTAANEGDVDSTPNNKATAPTEDDTASASVTPGGIDLSIAKTVNNATAAVGSTVVYTVVVTNATGVNNATGVVVTDLLPTGMTFVSNTATQGTYVSGTGVWTVGAINAGASATLTITATVATTGAKTNTAEVTAADQTDIDSTPNNKATAPNEDDTSSIVVTPGSATTIDLSLTKTVNTPTPNKNANVTFTVTVSNAAGQANATGVVVTDLLPAGMTFVSSTPSVGTYNATTGVWTVGNVNAGSSATLSIVATVTTIGAKTNTAEVTAAGQTDIDSTPNNKGTAPNEDDTASAVVTPAVADLSITKTVNDSTPDRNQNVVFTITLANGGPQAATNVAVTDVLPAGFTFVSSTPSTGTYSSTTGIWTVPTLASAANATLTITATVTTVGVKTNIAEVTASDQFDSDSTPGNRATAPSEDDSASVTLTPNSTDLSVTKSVNDIKPDIGDNITFTITVSNTSTTAATNVVLTDLLPNGLTFVSSNPSQGTYVAGTGLWTIGTVAANSSVTLTVIATVTDNSTKVNAAEITSLDQFDIDSIPGNGGTSEDDRAVVTVQPFILSKRLGVVR
ncbi:beta strand repeat-containing protein [Anatilimnocola floriformis]|uniref:beta strand repeat-containing protein n=1 Tax=Anatilimnocola floriformis TaxID=2948575 RepID=UPI0020C49C90|nr:SpaA isopeptide-forming pilin-related protein [Anatilimnocola floriformis]